MEKRKSIYYSLAIQFIGLLGSLLSRVVYARFLDEGSFGELNLLILFPSMIALFINFGIGHSISLHVSKGRKHRSQLIKFIFIYSFSIGILASLFSYMLFSNLYDNLDDILIGISISLVSIHLFVYLISFLFLGQERTTTFFLLSNGVYLLSPVSFVFLYQLNGPSTLTGILAHSISLAGVFIVSIFLLLKDSETGSYTEEQIFSLVDLGKSLFKKGLPMYSASIINFFNYRLDSFIIAKLLPFSFLGNYSLAVLIVDGVGKISQTLSLILFSRIPRLEGQARIKLTNQYLLIIFLINILISILLICFLNIVIGYFFNGEYSMVYETVIYLLPGMLFIGLFRIIYHQLAASGMAKEGTIATALSLIATLILDIILIPILDIKGAAIASSVAYFVSFIYIFYVYKRYKKELN